MQKTRTSKIFQYIYSTIAPAAILILLTYLYLISQVAITNGEVSLLKNDIREFELNNQIMHEHYVLKTNSLEFDNSLNDKASDIVYISKNESLSLARYAD